MLVRANSRGGLLGLVGHVPDHRCNRRRRVPVPTIQSGSLFGREYLVPPRLLNCDFASAIGKNTFSKFPPDGRIRLDSDVRTGQRGYSRAPRPVRSDEL